MKPVEGHLEIHDKGFGFLRRLENNFQPAPEDTFVPAHLIRKLGLPEGAWIVGQGGKGDGKNRNLKLAAVETINGITTGAYADIRPIQEQTSIDPLERFTLTQSPDDVMGRALDLLVPMGKGQRGLIISPPKSGKTTIMKHMANSVLANHPDTAVFVLLVDERPEEVTDFKRSLPGAHVLSSSADQSVSQHMRMTRLAMNTALRMVETGMDAVVFIDSLTRMARAFNTETRSYGRTMTGGLGANALQIPRQIFGAARKIENGGSLTIIATILVDTGSRMDDIIFQEFKGTGNMDLVLSRECAEQRIWPAIRIHASGTRKEHLLFEEEEFKGAVDIRRKVASRDDPASMSEFLRLLEDSAA